MNNLMKERILEEAQYTINMGATVRQTADEFSVSKSTVHKDITVQLPKLSLILSELVKDVLRKNKAERHIKGGEATRLKYLKIKENIKSN